MKLLDGLGATALLRQHAAAQEFAKARLGRISFASQEQFRVWLDTGEAEAVLAGRLRFENQMPVVGDWVLCLPTDPAAGPDELGRQRLVGLLPRRNGLVRRAAGPKAEAQWLAANVDLALLVSGLDQDFNPRRITRYAQLCRQCAVPFRVVLNKADCAKEPEEMQASAASAAGVEWDAVTRLQANCSVAALLPWVVGRTTVLLGSSGVGKSTIVNGLLQASWGGALQGWAAPPGLAETGSGALIQGWQAGPQPTASVRAQDSRGRHTTTARMLLPLATGCLIDTPGLREVQLLGGPEVEEAFPSVLELAADCRFRDCRHGAEPGCAVRAAVAAGRLPSETWAHYQKLQAEQAYAAREQDLHQKLAEKRRWKTIHKAMRQPKKGW